MKNIVAMVRAARAVETPSPAQVASKMMAAGWQLAASQLPTWMVFTAERGPGLHLVATMIPHGGVYGLLQVQARADSAKIAIRFPSAPQHEPAWMAVEAGGLSAAYRVDGSVDFLLAVSAAPGVDGRVSCFLFDAYVASFVTLFPQALLRRV